MNAVRYPIGFHTSGSGGNPTGIGDFVRALDGAGRPAAITCVDGVVGISDALQCINSGSQVKHTLCWRLVAADNGEAGGNNEYYAVPKVNGVDYGGTPEQAGEWIAGKLLQFMHPTVAQNKAHVWISLFNEVDKNRADYLGKAALKAAQILNVQGYKVMAFAFSSGEPESEHWLTEGMKQYLKYCVQSNGMAGVALHEYSYDATNLFNGEGFKVYRFKQLLAQCEAMGIDWSRLPILIKEFGYTHNQLPSVERCVEQMGQAAGEYAKYPNILGATTWYLGGGFGIEHQTNALINPIKQQALAFNTSAVQVVVPNLNTEPPAGEILPPRVDYTRRTVVWHRGDSDAVINAALQAAKVKGYSCGCSADDAGFGVGLLSKRYAILINPQLWGPDMPGWYNQYYPGTIYSSVSSNDPNEVYRFITGEQPPTQPPPPQPPAGGYSGPPVAKPIVRGVDSPASDWRHEAWDVYRGTGLYPKFHTGGVNPDKWEGFKHPSFNPVRILLNPSFQGGAQAIYNEVRADVERFYVKGARDFVVLNEPNIEGMGIRWSNGSQFGVIFSELCFLLKQGFGGVRLWYPGCSPGFGAQHTFIADSARAGAFTHIYGIVEHVYSGNTSNTTQAAQGMFDEVMDFRRRWAYNRPLMIGEFSVNLPASAQYKADVYRRFYDLLNPVAGIAAAYSFTASWHPHEDYTQNPPVGRNQESWYERGVDDYFRG
jgi:hypothetical protein